MIVMREWGGWKLVGQLLLAPKKVKLSPGEARLMEVLLLKSGHWTPAQLLTNHLSIKTMHLRTLVSTLRVAIGRTYIQNHRERGYRLLHINSKELKPKSDLALLTEHLVAAAKISKRLLKKETP